MSAVFERVNNRRPYGQTLGDPPKAAVARDCSSND
jgi:hypothetical protein